MKYLFFFSFLIIQGISLSGPDDSIVNMYRHYDSVLTRVNYTSAGMEEKKYMFDSLLYFGNADSIKSFIKNKNFSGPSGLNEINFADSALLLVGYRGVDCHSGFDIKILSDEINREYKFIVNAIYGGCRSGGKHYTFWFQMPKLPEGYNITYHWYYTDVHW
jgi:hypothetical protein